MNDYTLKLEKVIAALPDVLTPNTMYLVRVGEGIDIYVTNSTGSVAHKHNTTSLNDDTIKVDYWDLTKPIIGENPTYFELIDGVVNSGDLQIGNADGAGISLATPSIPFSEKSFKLVPDFSVGNNNSLLVYFGSKVYNNAMELVTETPLPPLVFIIKTVDNVSIQAIVQGSMNSVILDVATTELSFSVDNTSKLYINGQYLHTLPVQDYILGILDGEGALGAPAPETFDFDISDLSTVEYGPTPDPENTNSVYIIKTEGVYNEVVYKKDEVVLVKDIKTDIVKLTEVKSTVVNDAFKVIKQESILPELFDVTKEGDSYSVASYTSGCISYDSLSNFKCDINLLEISSQYAYVSLFISKVKLKKEDLIQYPINSNIPQGTFYTRILQDNPKSIDINGTTYQINPVANIHGEEITEQNVIPFIVTNEYAQVLGTRYSLDFDGPFYVSLILYNSLTINPNLLVNKNILGLTTPMSPGDSLTNTSIIGTYNNQNISKNSYGVITSDNQFNKLSDLKKLETTEPKYKAFKGPLNSNNTLLNFGDIVLYQDDVNYKLGYVNKQKAVINISPTSEDVFLGKININKYIDNTVLFRGNMSVQDTLKILVDQAKLNITPDNSYITLFKVNNRVISYDSEYLGKMVSLYASADELGRAATDANNGLYTKIPLNARVYYGSNGVVDLNSKQNITSVIDLLNFVDESHIVIGITSNNDVPGLLDNSDVMTTDLSGFTGAIIFTNRGYPVVNGVIGEATTLGGNANKIRFAVGNNTLAITVNNIYDFSVYDLIDTHRLVYKGYGDFTYDIQITQENDPEFIKTNVVQKIKDTFSNTDSYISSNYLLSDRINTTVSSVGKVSLGVNPNNYASNLNVSSQPFCFFDQLVLISSGNFSNSYKLGITEDDEYYYATSSAVTSGNYGNAAINIKHVFENYSLVENRDDYTNIGSTISKLQLKFKIKSDFVGQYAFKIHSDKLILEKDESYLIMFLEKYNSDKIEINRILLTTLGDTFTFSLLSDYNSLKERYITTRVNEVISLNEHKVNNYPDLVVDELAYKCFEIDAPDSSNANPLVIGISKDSYLRHSYSKGRELFEKIIREREVYLRDLSKVVKKSVGLSNISTTVVTTLEKKYEVYFDLSFITRNSSLFGTNIKIEANNAEGTFCAIYNPNKRLIVPSIKTMEGADPVHDVKNFKMTYIKLNSNLYYYKLEYLTTGEVIEGVDILSFQPQNQTVKLKNYTYYEYNINTAFDNPQLDSKIFQNRIIDFTLGSNETISTVDSLNTALGKLQAQINAIKASLP